MFWLNYIKKTLKKEWKNVSTHKIKINQIKLKLNYNNDTSLSKHLKYYMKTLETAVEVFQNLVKNI